MAYKRKRYRYKLRYKLVFWSLIAMLIFTILMRFMTQPTTGTVIKHKLGDELVQESAKTNTIMAKYFSLVYDAGLDTVSDISQGDQTALEVYRVARSDTTGRRNFVITIKELSGGLGEESSYRLRRINPQTYRESSESFGDLAYVLFEKTDGTEMTGFVSYSNNRYAMLSYTMDAPSGDLYKESSELFNRFRWQ